MGNCDTARKGMSLAGKGPPVMSWLSLRLTLVTETYPPEVNGVARTLKRWVATFRERGHHVHVIRPRQRHDNPSPDHVHGLPLPLYPQMRFGVASPVRLRNILRRHAPDLVHIATEGPLGLAALLAAISLNLPVASSFHTNYDHYLRHYGFGALGPLLFGYLRWFHNRTAVTLVPSEATRQRLLADGVRGVELWSRGVDADLFHPRHRDPVLRQELGLRPDDVLLMYVGRLAAEKNLGALLRAFVALRQRLAGRVRLALVGHGPLAEPLRALDLPGVIFAGERHGTELSRWYASADVFAFPSLSETFGNVILEAQASGLPVVGIDCQAVRERVKDGCDGLLVPPGAEMTDALDELCRRRELRESLSAAARVKAERQVWGPIFDGLEERYVRLVAEAGNARDLQIGFAVLHQNHKRIGRITQRSPGRAPARFSINACIE
jgi:glycosyltransferase involved in cell wall biosynthesis